MSQDQGPPDVPPPPAGSGGSNRKENLVGALGCLILLPVAGVVAILAVGVLVSDPVPWIAAIALLVALAAFSAVKRGS